MIGFVTDDVTVTGGTKGAFTAVSATTYTLAVTPAGSANVVVTVAANSVTDGLNAGPESAVSATAIWDTAAPRVTIGGVPSKINSTAAFTATFTFDEDVTGFATGDVTVTGGTKGAFARTNARVYTLAVMPTSGSNVVVTVAANSATDGLNTGPASAVSATATWDATAPTVTIGGVPSQINSTATLSVTFRFSEAVTGFATGDVTVTGGTKGAFASTSASVYTLAVTPTSGSNVVVTVAANSATDGGGNTGPASAVSATATWDAAAPTVEIDGVPSTINSTAALGVAFTFSEDVTGFATGDVTVTGGTKGAFASTSASVYTLAVTPTSGSNVVVTVAANSATDGGGNTGPASAVSATATWDAAAVVLSPTSLDVDEGDDASYTVKLATEPTNTVTVAITVPAGTDLTLDKTSLTFTTSTWDDVQTVTVTAGEDDDAAEDTATLAHAASGGGYGTLSVDLPVTVTDDDTVGLVLSPTSLGVAEGDAASYTVKLGTEPTNTVTVAISGQSGTDLTLDKTSLTFTTSTWNDVQTVTVTAGEDPDTTNDTATLAHEASGGGYGDVDEDLAVTVTDNDTPGLVLSPTSLTVAEGDDASYTVKLATAPTNTVTVAIALPAGTDLTLDKTSLTFTTTSWNDEQTVTVTAGEDDDTANDTATLMHTASGGGYSVTASLPVTVIDNDTLPVVSFALPSSSAGEAAGTRNVTVNLSPAPTAATTVSYTVGGSAAAGSDFSISGSGDAVGLVGGDDGEHPGGDHRRHGGREQRDRRAGADGGQRLHRGEREHPYLDDRGRRRHSAADGEPVGRAEPGDRRRCGDGDGAAVRGAVEQRDGPADADGGLGRAGGLRLAGEHHHQRRTDHGDGQGQHGAGRRRGQRDIHRRAGHAAAGGDTGQPVVGAGDDPRRRRRGGSAGAARAVGEQSTHGQGVVRPVLGGPGR